MSSLSPLYFVKQATKLSSHLQVAIAAWSKPCHGLDGQGQAGEALVAVVAAQWPPAAI